MQIKCTFSVWLLGLSFFASLSAQDYLTISQLDRRDVKRMEAAKQAINRQAYSEATRALDAILDRTPQAIDALLLRAGVAYEAQRFAAAEIDYEAAYQMAPEYDEATLYRLARTEMQLGKYEEAVAHFEAYLAQGDRNPRRVERAEKYLAQARVAQELYAQPVAFAPKSLGDSINTVGGKEYLPSFSADGTYLIYTVNYDGQEDFYYSKRLADGNWAKGKPLDEVNTPYNEGAQSISADARILFFTGCRHPDGLGNGSCDLYYVVRKNGRWQEIQHPAEPLNSRHWDAQPSLSANGKYLLFASDRPGGYGGNDL
ncbi:MAG: hypothetical protein D6772_11830, partial [Bacteroidetes bacterium]